VRLLDLKSRNNKNRRLKMKYIMLTSIFFSLVISLPVLAVDTKEVQEDLARPINCPTAEGDIRVLKSEKAHVGKKIAAGVESIAPPSLVFHLIKHTEDDQIKVATGEYDKMIDKRIAEIEADCL
jgi:hypothetical protein